MKKEHKYSIGLALKILIVLLLPLLLFSYIDTQPTTVANDDDDKGTRSVAIVNEDLGYEGETEELLLGQDITSILNEQEDYSWAVVNRSAAEQGFDNEEYDAILYLPSNFSENVMTFKDDSPAKASINYVIQPNLEAKERQRVHREMANAKSKINYEMSTIYWSYVSQEVDNIRDQFDKVLEKEIAFQDAMYSFYSPSSEKLSNEIDRHKDRLEGILDQTDRIYETTTEDTNSATEAEEKVADFIDSLDAYKESQSEQSKLLSEFDEENQKSIQDSVDRYDETIETSMKDIEEKFKQQSVLVVNQEDKLQSRFNTMEGKLYQSQDIIDDWRSYQEGNRSKQKTNFEDITVDIIDEYNDYILDEWFTEANEAFDESIDEFLEAPITATLVEPIEPEQTELGEFSFEELEEAIDTLETEIEAVKEATNDGEDPVDWEKVDASLQVLAEEIADVNNNEKHEVANEVIDDWVKYAEQWEENYRTIIDETDKVTTSIVSDVEKKQEEILKSKTLSDKRKDKLKKKFNQIEELENKTVISLVSYLESLTSYQTVIDQKTNLNEGLIEDILDSDEIKEQIEDMLEVNYTFADELEKVLGVSNSKKSTKATREQEEEDFMKLVQKAESNLKEFNEEIQERITDNEALVEEMSENAAAVAQQINDANNETFDMDISSALDEPDGQMVFHLQKGTASSLESLSNQVSRLGESQDRITTDTEELQANVGSVQEESDELNTRWSSNVETTEKVKDDVYDVLGNTMVDGQANPFVYDYLANPVNVEGQVEGEVLTESDDRLPPVVLFIIILLSGLMIGFLTQYYSNTSYIVQGGLFVLMNVAVGLIISIYGLNIYPLADSQAIMWSAFTIVLLMACSNIIRGGLFVGPFVGWIASIAMIMFFISPLLNVVVPEFSFNNPVSNVYMGLLYGTSASYVLTMVSMIIIILIVSALIYTLQVMRNKAKAEEANEEQAS